MQCSRPAWRPRQASRTSLLRSRSIWKASATKCYIWSKVPCHILLSVVDASESSGWQATGQCRGSKRATSPSTLSHHHLLTQVSTLLLTRKWLPAQKLQSFSLAEKEQLRSSRLQKTNTMSSQPKAPSMLSLSGLLWKQAGLALVNWLKKRTPTKWISFKLVFSIPLVFPHPELIVPAPPDFLRKRTSQKHPGFSSLPHPWELLKKKTRVPSFNDGNPKCAIFVCLRDSIPW